jgi:excisionase family DNA binding protein
MRTSACPCDFRSVDMNTPTTPEPRLAYSPGEAARAAGISRTKLYEAISSGDLRTFKLGSRRLIRVQALEEWLRSFEAA